jgi:hypothetical protein
MATLGSSDRAHRSWNTTDTDIVIVTIEVKDNLNLTYNLTKLAFAITFRRVFFNGCTVDAPPLSVMGDGPPLEVEDHEDSTFEASMPVRVLAPTSACKTFDISRKPVGENTKIETLGSE